MTDKPKYEKGNYRVTRWCCTSGNCVHCRGFGNREKRKHVVQTDNVSKDWAKYVAANWHTYGAKAEPMPKAGEAA
jgi:hypothetical protein